MLLRPMGERWESLGHDTAALVIMDNFKGQVTESVMGLLEDHNIHVCLLPPNTTDRLQPMEAISGERLP